MVTIDTVYQRVLALANKEQRGYITPQEFNLFANQAQLEILDSYINDINGVDRLPGNKQEFSDRLTLLDEKLSIFEVEEQVTTGDGLISNFPSSTVAFPVNLYNLGSVYRANTECDQITRSEWQKYGKSPLLFGTMYNSTPRYVLVNNMIHVFPTANFVNISYIRKPAQVSWGYVVINDKALYDPNPNKTVNFELHASEETELVYRILKLSGVAIQRQDVAQFAQAQENTLSQKEKQ